MNIDVSCNNIIIAVDELEEAMQIFDGLFRQIVTIHELSCDVTNGKIQSYEIQASQITLPQRDKIKNIAGHLKSAYDAVNKLRIFSCDNSNNLIEGRLEKYEKELLAHKKTERKHLKMICALQEYLVNELNRNEQLENQLKAKETALVNAIQARKDLQAKYTSTKLSILKSESLSSSSASTVQKNDSTIKKSIPFSDAEVAMKPQLLINQYVRRIFQGDFFFGLVLDYEAPYYKIVYEDADEEEMSRQEVFKYLWNDPVPSAKIAHCQRHGKKILSAKNQINSVCNGKADSNDFLEFRSSSSSSVSTASSKVNSINVASSNQNSSPTRLQPTRACNSCYPTIQTAIQDQGVEKSPSTISHTNPRSPMTTVLGKSVGTKLKTVANPAARITSSSPSVSYSEGNLGLNKPSHLDSKPKSTINATESLKSVNIFSTNASSNQSGRMQFLSGTNTTITPDPIDGVTNGTIAPSNLSETLVSNKSDKPCPNVEASKGSDHGHGLIASREMNFNLHASQSPNTLIPSSPSTPADHPTLSNSDCSIPIQSSSPSKRIPEGFQRTTPRNISMPRWSPSIMEDSHDASRAQNNGANEVVNLSMSHAPANLMQLHSSNGVAAGNNQPNSSKRDRNAMEQCSVSSRRILKGFKRVKYRTISAPCSGDVARAMLKHAPTTTGGSSFANDVNG